MSGSWAAAVLVLVSLPVLFWRLGAPPIDRSMEGREALVVQEMVRSGNWILPRRNGEDVPHKPPLMHWIGASIATVRGGVVDETTTRLPSALASLASLLLLYALVAREKGPAAGLTAALFLLTTRSFSRQAREGWVDPVLAAGVLATLVVFRVLERREAWRGPPVLIFAAVLGVTVMAKGPIGALLPAVAVALYLLWTRRTGRLLDLVRPGPLAVFMAVAASWYVFALAQGGTLFLRTHVLDENLLRFVRAPERVEPPWYYLEVFFIELAPWSFLVPFAAFWAWRRREPSLETFALAWLAGPLVFLSLSAGKRGVYLLPLAPAAAILVEAWLARLSGWRAAPPRIARAAALGTGVAIAALLLWTAGAAAGWLPGGAALEGLGADVRRRTLRPLASAVAGHPGVTVASLLAIAASAGVTVLGILQGVPRRVLAGVLAFQLAYVSFLKPLRWEAYKRDRSLQPFALAAKSLVGDGRLHYLGTGEIPHAFFYLGRHVPRAPCVADPRGFSACPPGHYIVNPDLWTSIPPAARGAARVVLESQQLQAEPAGVNYLLVARGE